MPKKTNVLTISCKKEKVAYPNLLIDDTILSDVPNHKHLGLIISENMLWTPHVDVVCSTAGTNLNVL